MSQCNDAIELSQFSDAMNTDDFEIIPAKENCCSTCDSTVEQTYTTYTDKTSNDVTFGKKKVKCCYLCHIILNFRPAHASKMFLIKSHLSQKKINRLVNSQFQRGRVVDSVLRVDGVAQLIPLSVHRFVLFSDDDRKQLLNDKLNYKVYFTYCVVSGMGKKFVASLFIKKKDPDDDKSSNDKSSNDKSSDDHQNVPIYCFQNFENNIINKYVNAMNAEKATIIQRIQRQLADKSKIMLSVNK
jgi:hypothetical protein